MPSETFTYTAAQGQRLATAFADIFNYDAYAAVETQAGRTPMTKGQWVRHQTIQFWKGIVRDSEARLARKAAEQNIPDLGDIT